MINYTETPDWDAKARELTDGRGVDCIVEIGGPRTIAMSLSALTVDFEAMNRAIAVCPQAKMRRLGGMATPAVLPAAHSTAPCCIDRAYSTATAGHSQVSANSDGGG